MMRHGLNPPCIYSVWWDIQCNSWLGFKPFLLPVYGTAVLWRCTVETEVKNVHTLMGPLNFSDFEQVNEVKYDSTCQFDQREDYN